MLKYVLLCVIGWSTATAAFSIAHGASEYLSALSSHTTVLIDGNWRTLTPNEELSELIHETIRAIPYGAGVSGLLFIPLLLTARKLRTGQGAGSYLLGFIAGVFAGSIFSIVTWIMLGGWGPPFLIPAITDGVVLSPFLIYSFRKMNLAESIQISV